MKNQQSEYDIYKHNTDWIKYGPCYNTSICTKLHGAVFETYTRNARTYRCNILYLIDANRKQQPSYVDDGIIGGGNAISLDSK